MTTPIRMMMLAAVLVSFASHADVDRRFAELRDTAEPLTSVAAFVDKYVGECPVDGTECQKSAEGFRRASTGKRYYMIITESTASVLSMGEVNPAEGTVVLNLTPFFAGNDAALTHGAPARTDGSGNPVLGLLRIEGTLPEGWSPPMMARQVQAQALRLQVIFTPLSVWTLPRKGGGKIHGVKARFDAVLVTVGRTGEQVGLYLDPKASR